MSTAVNEKQVHAELMALQEHIGILLIDARKGDILSARSAGFLCGRGFEMTRNLSGHPIGWNQECFCPECRSEWPEE